ncbi:MAG: LPS export ABC transporter permease LptG [Dissulfuribacterales bacterium]
MKILDLYIGRALTRHFLVVLFILCFMFSLFEFHAQVDDVGKGAYHYMDALFFVILTFPSRMLDLIPESILIGTIIALGLMEGNNELLAMRAGGISVWRICRSVLTAALLFMVSAVIISEFVAPSLDQYARTRRLAALADTDIVFTKKGFWVHKSPFFIHVNKISGGIPNNINIFKFNDKGRLSVFTHAGKADISKNKQWVLKNVIQRNISEQEITSRNKDRLSLNLFLPADQMAIQELPPEGLSPSDLYQYIQTLQKSGQNADQYRMVFWQRITTPLSMIAMTLLSLTFVFGPTRATTAGYKIMLAVIVGIALHFINQILGLIGLFLGVSPALTTLVPVIIILCLALWILSHSQ